MKDALHRLACMAGMAWALPCTLFGAVFALAVWLTGGGVRRMGPAIEVFFHEGSAPAGSVASRLPFVAITLGQVIVGVSRAELERVRTHEHVHVRQYLWLGPLFFVAYPLASLLAVLRGKRMYADNLFEIHATRLSNGSLTALRRC